MATTKISDVVVPERFTSYVQQLTEEKSRLIQSGTVVRAPFIDDLLGGGGLTFNTPSWKDLPNDDANISTDNDASLSVPKKTGTAQEIAVRMNRNQSWSSMDLTAVLAGDDPMASIGGRVADYWVRQSQLTFIATVMGLFADNEAAPAGTDTHSQNDLTNDISGGGYVAGVTDFSAEASLDATLTMGDSEDDLSLIMVHSVTYNRMKKNNLIDFIPDARGETRIATFMEHLVIVDDGLPNPAGAGAAATAAGIYHSWYFGPGAMQWGMGSPEVPTETERLPRAGDGAGQEILHNRVEWTFHPTGHAFKAASIANGGPSNATTIHNLAHADSWSRVWEERKMIKVARLIHRES